MTAALDTVDQPSAMACLTVADTGVGMPPEIVARIFNPFFTTKPRGQGTGLGLSIIHSIVEDHGGYIEVDSQPGLGSTFRIFLPCVAPQPGTEVAFHSAAAPPGRGELIVVAEGRRLVRELIVSTLESLGYQVLAAADDIALQQTLRERGNQVGLLIVDSGLPQAGGVACLSALRAAGVTTPGIMIAAAADADLEQHLDGDTVVLRQPFDMNALGRLVYNLLHADDGVQEDAA